jgi:Transposase
MCRTVDLKALCKVELKAMLNGMVEIISGRERRRRWGVEEKLRIVAETQEAGACVREVAARHDQACCTTGGDSYARVGLSRHHLLDLFRSAWPRHRRLRWSQSER